MPPPGSDPLVGTTIGQYEILAKLGGGGMGVVYKARDAKLGRHVALKFLPSQWSHDEVAKQRFIREAQSASATDHRNICTIHDITSADDGRLFIVMALYDGPTLKQKLHEGPLTIDEALDIATQVAEGLAKAHASGVVHRDIKPGNLIITEDAVKIVDFGLAKFADTLQLTTAGSTLGTAAYMSPEQVRGEDTGPQTDVWAVGVILYEMLAGHPPFRGAYAEAIAHAIRTDTPVPLRNVRPDVTEEIEQVVFRALHKDLGVRFASGREFARALRQARGQSLPQDLVTQQVEVRRALVDTPLRSHVRWRAFAAAAAAILLVAVLASWWLLRPSDRVPILVAPVSNQTGNSELEGYRLALTLSLVQQLRASPRVLVVPFPKILQTLRRFLLEGGDIGSREALEALSTASGAQIAVLPSLLYEDRTWRGRVELRDTTTATNIATYETAGVVSSLSKDTAQRLVTEIAGLVQRHFESRTLSRFFAGTAVAPALSTLDAEKNFEEGVNWYEEQEYAAAYRAFAVAADEDSRNPLPRAWASRAALVMRQDDEAKSAADRATQLLTDRTPRLDRLFIEAVVAEAREDFMIAETRLRDLVARYPDDVTWTMELAAFHDRRAASRDGWSVAVTEYHNALKLDTVLIRPHLELCRLYNRLQEPANAKQQGQQALSKYQAAGWRGGEALARFCIVDTLRVGSAAERQQAREHAEAALKILQDLQFPYNLSRAWYYLGTSSFGQARFAEASSFFERAATAARESGNIVLQPLLLMNLGVTHGRLGDVSRAADFYRQSAALYDQLGDERRAAQQQANSGALRIVYGIDVKSAIGEVQNALAVFQKLGDTDFEVACLESIGIYHRYAARYADAERELGRALARAKERNLDDKIASVTLALARVSFDKTDYGAARSRLLNAVDEKGRAGASALTLLGRVHTRLGDFDSAQANFADAESDLNRRADGGLRRELDLALGELAYELGRADEARAHFRRAAGGTNTTGELLLSARGYLALLDAFGGRPRAGRDSLLGSVEQARNVGVVSLEATLRVLLARVSLLERRPKDALTALQELSDVRERGLGMETRALIHYWRGTARLASGDAAGAAEVATARALVAEMGRSLPEMYRERFAARRDITTVSE